MPRLLLLPLLLWELAMAGVAGVVELAGVLLLPAATLPPWATGLESGVIEALWVSGCFTLPPPPPPDNLGLRPDVEDLG